MRGALKKPTGNLSARVQHISTGFNPQRELRARKITQDSHVERFGRPAGRPKPALQGEIVSRQPSASRIQASSQSQTAAALPSMVTSASHQKLERLLDQALTQADAHKQALRYQAARHFWQKPGFFSRRPLIKLTAAGLLVVVIGSYFAWQKFPQLSVKLASARAHVAAAVPAYKPDGYQLAAPASAQSGTVVIKYKAPNSTQGFDIAQKSSDMTSTSLAQAVVPKDTQVQTSHVEGSTVYIYGPNNDAAWVNNGVLYTIKDHSKLSSDQILKIVSGLN